MNKKWQFAKQVRGYGEIEKRYLSDVVDRGALSSFDNEDGYLARFSSAFAEYVGAKIAIPRANAMIALAEAVSFSGGSTGYEVLCDPIVHFGAVAAVYFNAVPRFVDVRYDTYNMDPASLEANITERSKAVIVTHLWGEMAEMEAIRDLCRRHNLFLIEDCAHAIDARWNGKHAGTFGDLGVFSFQEFKQLSTGDGAMTVTGNERLAHDITHTRVFSGEVPLLMTMNFRMNELTAAFGLAQLQKVHDRINDVYNRTLRILNEAIAGCRWLTKRVVLPEANQSGYWFACTWEGDKHGLSLERFKAVIAELGLPVTVGFVQKPQYLHSVFSASTLYGHPDCPVRCPIYAGTSRYRYREGLCPSAEELIPRLLTINLIFLSVEEAEQIAEKLREAIRRMEN